MSASDPPLCRSCKAPIIWATTPKGRAIPITAAPNDNGNIVLLPAPDPRDGQIAVMDVKRRLGGPRYIAHFVDCPDAAKFRKAKP